MGRASWSPTPGELPGSLAWLCSQLHQARRLLHRSHCTNAMVMLLHRGSRLHQKTSWQSLIRQRLPEVAVEADESALAEELNVAWAQHELASDPMDAVFNWLEAEISSARLMAAVKP